MNAIAWQMLIGLGIFLYGMSRLENGIQSLSAVRLKQWLANSTGKPFSSAVSGAAVTAILQSSSMVSLLVLAFASAGIIPLYNAIGVLLGANLGTTFTGWIVATLGFKLDLTAIALPLFGLGGLSQVLFDNKSKLQHWGKVALGLGLLLFGLSLMKESVSDLPQRWDISLLQGYHPLIYLLSGVAAAALIQSSSAVVMMTLAALHGGLISLPEAGALVIGADLGTTSTTFLGSLTGPNIKRQLAMAHIIFNVVVDLAAFVLFLPLLPWMVSLLNLSDPLYSLVAFHSIINLFGIAAFLPLLKHYSLWISTRFSSRRNGITSLEEIPIEVPEAALPALCKHLQQLWMIAAINNMQYFSLNLQQLNLSANTRETLGKLITDQTAGQNISEVYEQIKRQEVEILQFSFRLQQQPLNEEDASYLSRLTELTRTIVYASKTLRDISGDLDEISEAMRHSMTGAVGWIYSEQRQFQQQLYQNLLPLIAGQHNEAFINEQIETLENDNNRHYEKMNQGVYQRSLSTDSELLSLSTLLNVNREIHHATKSLISSATLWQSLSGLLEKWPAQQQ